MQRLKRGSDQYSTF